MNTEQGTVDVGQETIEIPTTTVEWAYWVKDTLAEIAEKRNSPLFPTGFQEYLASLGPVLQHMHKVSIFFPMINAVVATCNAPTSMFTSQLAHEFIAQIDDLLAWNTDAKRPLFVEHVAPSPIIVASGPVDFTARKTRKK